jgi:hypothetical protein
MKKLLIVLLALTVIGLFAFADDAMAPAPVSGWHVWNQGDFIPYASVDGGSGIAGFGPNWDTAKGGDQEWDFTYDGKNFGFDAGTQFGTDAAFADSFNLDWFDMYFKFGDSANPFAKFIVGDARNSSYNVMSYINGNPVEQRMLNGYGEYMGELEFYPMAGLSLAVVNFVPAVLQTAAPVATANLAANFAIAGQYTIPDTATIMAFYKAYQTNGPAGVAGIDSGDTSTPGIVNNQYLSVGAKFTAIKNIGVQAALAYDFSTVGNGSGTDAATAMTAFYVGATTSMIPNLALSADFFLHTNSNYTVFTIEAQGTYTLTPAWGVGAFVGYDEGAGQFNGGSGDSVIAGFNGAGAGFLLFPYLNYTVDGGNGNVKVGFCYVSGGVSNDANLNVKTLSAWGIPIVYTVSF